MTYSLKNIVPWGRTFDEYQAMFALTDDDLTKAILGCADGPASFNAELTARNGRIVSTDPLYAYSKADIQQRIDAIYDEVVEQARQNQDQFVWQHIPSVESLGELRMMAMSRFLADYEAGKKNGRYQTASLPHLPFADNQFDLALCSHFLFLYSEQLSEEFHDQAVRELLRVAHEVRIFPLLDLTASPSKHLNPIMQKLKKEGHQVDILTVSYEFQRGGNQMCRIS
ncbi:MAG: methyltransferase domain-containing protein [Chloroflexota bacterium]